jgi:hypothetical protein
MTCWEERAPKLLSAQERHVTEKHSCHLYPYQELLRSRDSRIFTLAYEVEAGTPAGGEFETESLFVGTYAYKGWYHVAATLRNPAPLFLRLGVRRLGATLGWNGI